MLLQVSCKPSLKPTIVRGLIGASAPVCMCKNLPRLFEVMHGQTCNDCSCTLNCDNLCNLYTGSCRCVATSTDAHHIKMHPMFTLCKGNP